MKSLMHHKQVPEVGFGFPGQRNERPRTGNVGRRARSILPQDDQTGGHQQVPQFLFFRVQRKPRPPGQFKESRQVGGAVIVGVPAVQVGNLGVRSQPPGKAGFFHEERQPLEQTVLNRVIGGIEDQDVRKAIPAEDLVAGIAPGFPAVAQHKSRIGGDRIIGKDPRRFGGQIECGGKGWRRDGKRIRRIRQGAAGEA